MVCNIFTFSKCLNLDDMVVGRNESVPHPYQLTPLDGMNSIVKN